MKTLTKAGEGTVIEKKSKFIAEAFPVSGEAEAREKLDRIRKKYFDASHHVYAYITKETVKYSDDGEPSGTAGRPIYDIMCALKLQGAMVVVTRYFGGTLLGTGGLLRAYSKAAKEALEDAKVSEVTTYVYAVIRADYGKLARLRALASEKNAKECGIEYGEDICVKLLLREEEAPGFEAALTERFDGRLQAEFSEPVRGVLQGDEVIEVL